MLKGKASELLEKKSEDEVLIQGTIDLIIFGDKNIVVDYKRTSIKDEGVIKKKYEKQLNLYAVAAERILKKKIDKKIIYVLGQNKEIEI
jgi:ATP-dependent helicase/nuclease subunit A